MDKKFFAFVVLLAVLKSFGGETPAINIHADNFLTVSVTNGSK